MIQSCLLALVAAIAAYPAAGPAATAGTVVGATVPSATNIDASLCANGSAAVELGTVMPLSSVMTALDCRIRFGSSNDTASLRVSQRDGAGNSMYRPARSQLDSTYGVAGVATSAASGSHDALADLDVAADGSTVAVGTAAWNTGDSTMYVERRTSGGAHSPTFNGGAPLNWNPTGSSDRLFALARLSDGSVVVAGNANSNPYVRMLGPTGTTTWTQSGSAGTYMDVQVLADGKVYLLGFDWTGVANDYRTFVERRAAATGALDGSFGTGGRVDLNGIVSGVGTWGTRTDLIELPGGDILACGFVGPETGFDGAVWRLDPSGVPRASFGTAGRITFDVLGESNRCRDLLALDDGTVIATNDPFGATVSVAALKFNATTGAPVLTWGSSGWFQPAIPQTIRVVDGVELEDGSIAWGGTAFDGSMHRAALVQATSTGQPDLTVGPAGFLTFQGYDSPVAPPSSGAFAHSTDGRLYRATSRWTGADHDPAIVRLGSLPVPDYDGGANTWASGGGVFGACLVDASGTGATNVWPEAGTCTALDDGNWRGITTTADVIARSTTANTQDVDAFLRFGFRPRADQLPGRYIAPLRFEVLAPMV